MGILTPTAQNNMITVDAIMQNPSFIAGKVAELVEGQELVSVFLSPHAGPIVGGGLAHSVIRPSDKYAADDVVERAPGDEYATVRTTDPEVKIAAVRDWGARFFVEDEKVTRGDLAFVNAEILALSNTVVRKLNTAVLEAVDAALVEHLGVGGGDFPATRPWDQVVTVGAPDTITSNAERPLALLAAAQREADQDRLGLKFDTLVVSPTGAYDLTVAYGENLPAVLATAGVELVTSPYIDEATAYAVARGKAGLLAFETPLTTELIPVRERRGKFVQTYVNPVMAITQPRAIRRLTALVTP
ncbi:major capsid protein [Rhodococcus sp. B50]|uniref:major capsid protein n=1 Tax=Rhodococcus sp. B50 TaxID=2682847 RepID=UPI0019F4E9C7|nr:major capsid protein [Rhodococcus sp. B50]MBS9373613.1 hypothetical protein [Rhodococcus sp. B50]